MAVDKWGRPTFQGGLQLAQGIHDISERKDQRNERARQEQQLSMSREHARALLNEDSDYVAPENYDPFYQMQTEQATSAHRNLIDQDKQKKADEVVFSTLAQSGHGAFQTTNDIVMFAQENELPISSAFRALGRGAEQLQGSQEAMQTMRQMQTLEEKQEYDMLQHSVQQASQMYAGGRHAEALHHLQEAANSTTNPYQVQARDDGRYDVYFDEPGNLNDPQLYMQGVDFEEVAGMIQQTSFEQFDAYSQAHTQMVTEHNREALNNPLVFTDQQGGQFHIYDMKAPRPGMEDIIIVQDPQGNEHVFNSKKEMFSKFRQLRSTEELKRFWDTQKSMADTQDKKAQTMERGAGAQADPTSPMDSQRISNVVDPVLEGFGKEMNLTRQDKLNIRGQISRLHEDGMEVHQALEQVLMQRIENMPYTEEAKEGYKKKILNWIKDVGADALRFSPYGQAAAGLGVLTRGEGQADNPNKQSQQGEVRKQVQRPSGQGRQTVRRGTDKRTGRPVVMYNDGTVEYAD